MKYLCILNYGYEPGVYIYKIHKDEDCKNYISEYTDFQLCDIEWMEAPEINIHTII